MARELNIERNTVRRSLREDAESSGFDSRLGTARWRDSEILGRPSKCDRHAEVICLKLD